MTGTSNLTDEKIENAISGMGAVNTAIYVTISAYGTDYYTSSNPYTTPKAGIIRSLSGGTNQYAYGYDKQGLQAYASSTTDTRLISSPLIVPAGHQIWGMTSGNKSSVTFYPFV